MSLFLSLNSKTLVGAKNFFFSAMEFNCGLKKCLSH